MSSAVATTDDTKVVLCQSSACLNGNPPSKLECPTCNKYVDPKCVGLALAADYSP